MYVSCWSCKNSLLGETYLQLDGLVHDWLTVLSLAAASHDATNWWISWPERELLQTVYWRHE